MSSCKNNTSKATHRVRFPADPVSETHLIERYDAAGIEALFYTDDDYRRFRTEDIINLTRKTRTRVREMKRRVVRCQSADEQQESTAPNGCSLAPRRQAKSEQLEMAMAA